jgi:hypothetical protein
MDKATQDTTVTSAGATKKPRAASKKVPTVTIPNVVTVKYLAGLLDKCG